jgi:GSH-dependent disulfide-bond oxidoreductase
MPYPIELYFWPTPNGKKITIFLDEAALPYNLAPVDITAGEQFDEEFLKISPNNKMPAIVDPEGPDGEPISVFESELSWSTLPRRQADSCRTPSMADTKRCSG